MNCPNCQVVMEEIWETEEGAYYSVSPDGPHGNLSQKIDSQVGFSCPACEIKEVGDGWEPDLAGNPVQDPEYARLQNIWGPGREEAGREASILLERLWKARNEKTEEKRSLCHRLNSK